MKLKNHEVKALLDAMERLTMGSNRLPTLAAIRADRITRRLREAWASTAAVIDQLIRDHGEEKDGQVSVSPEMRGWVAFSEARAEALLAETEVNLESMQLADLEAGWSKDPETGKKDVLDISPADLGILVATGLVEVPEASSGLKAVS